MRLLEISDEAERISAMLASEGRSAEAARIFGAAPRGRIGSEATLMLRFRLSKLLDDCNDLSDATRSEVAALVSRLEQASEGA